MKTIKQIADELGISKDKAKYWVGKLPGDTRVKVGEITRVTPEGYLKLLDIIPGEEVGETGSSPGNLTRSLVGMLQRELEVKNKQIEELTTALTLAQQTAAHAQALHAGTIKHLTADEPEQEKKPGFFSRIFGKSKTVS